MLGSARKVSIYLCQLLGGRSLNAIKDYFGLNHIGSVSYVTSSIRAELREISELFDEVNAVKRLIIEKAG